MIHTKRVIFMILPLLFVPLVYGMSSTPDACAVPEAGWGSSKDCTITSIGGVLCCWNENGVEYCQTCYRIPYGTPGTEEGGWECVPKEKSLEQPPTPQPFDPTAPLQGGVFEQLPDQPPLFGRNEAAVPPTGGIVQPFTSTTPPLFGNVPLQGGGFEVLQEPETPPTFGQVAPQVAPLTVEPLTRTCPVGNVWDPKAMICVPDLPLPDIELCPDGSIPQSTGPGGIRPECPPFEAEQPEIQEPDEPEDEGQEEPDEGQETAGPLT